MKVPKARKLASGSWFIQLRLGGQSVPVTAATEKACIRQAQLIKAEYAAGKREIKASASSTLRVALDDYILSKSNVLSPSTLRGYRTVQRTRFQSVMDKPITPALNWQKIINAEAKLCSPKTLKNAWALVKAALKAQGIDADVTLPAIPSNERPYLTPEEVFVFIDAVHGEPCEIPALLALHSLRRSEILALDWSNIDLKNRLITVRGSVVFGEDQKLIEKATNKTKASTRTIPIMSDALYRALSGASPKQGKVTTINPNTLWAQINRICDAHNLPRVGVHGLRHSFASLAYHLGCSEAETMKLGGWDDITTMRKIYTHISSKDISDSAKRMSDFFNQIR